MNARVTAYIAVGSNLGDRAATIRTALERLASEDLRVMQISSLHEYEAVGGPDNSPSFLNGAAKLRTTLEPVALLNLLLDVERSLGRERLIKWSPRTIDLDLLLYDDLVLRTESLTLPHPLMHDREFVLEPLAEIAPEVVHPRLGWTIAELLKNLNV